MTNGDTLSNYDTDYRKEAYRWIVEVVIIGTIGSILNWFLIFNWSSSIFFVFIINVCLTVAGSILLFRHIDTLIFKRISQLQGNHTTHEDSDWVGESQTTTETEENEMGSEANRIVQNRRDTDIYTRVTWPLAVGFVIWVLFLLVAIPYILIRDNSILHYLLIVLFIFGPIVGYTIVNR